MGSGVGERETGMGCFPCSGNWNRLRRENKNKSHDRVQSGVKDFVNQAAATKELEVKKEATKDRVAETSKARTFTFEQLVAATENFKYDHFLGEGGYGRVYKGRLEDTGEIVAIRPLDQIGTLGIREFIAKVLTLSLAEHPNLVKLIGYCAEGEQRLLVYEFMPLGSLADHLHGCQSNGKRLDWNTRMKIAAGAARGLEYLHDKMNLIYRDLKCSDILLDEGYHPKLSYFGLANVGPVGDMIHVSTRVTGTYSAPEYVAAGHLTFKSDTYSFGVVLLEIITGRKAIDYARSTSDHNLVAWARPLFKDRRKFPQMVDPALEGQYPTRGLYQALAVAAMCIQEQPSMRPLIDDIVTALTYLASSRYYPESQSVQSSSRITTSLQSQDSKDHTSLINKELSELPASPSCHALTNKEISELPASSSSPALTNKELTELAASTNKYLPELMVSPNSPALINKELFDLPTSPNSRAVMNKELPELPAPQKNPVLMKKELFELPASPNCPVLVRLSLQGNLDLMVIPPNLFEYMPALQVLDLSYTSIKTLPDSSSKLLALREFLLKGCELLMKLPPSIGKLGNLEVLDLEGTELLYLPREIGELAKLMRLKVSFYGDANLYKKDFANTVIPKGALSNLSQLNELSIDILPNGDWWKDEVRDILAELSILKCLKQLQLYLPAVELLQELKWDSTSPIYPYLTSFRFVVGHQRLRFISRLPHEIVEEFNTLEKGLKYMNEKSIPTEIGEVLKHANAFFLERHWAVKSLSEFGIDSMDNLKFCLVAECKDLQTIIDVDKFGRQRDTEHGGEDEVHGLENILPSLQYLSIYYMMSMDSICNGTVGNGSLSGLKYLALHTCPSLTTIFTLSMLCNLVNLEELIVQDCPLIKTLINLECSDSERGHFLPRLKKMSLLQLPEMASISSDLSVAPKLERLVIFLCPELKVLYKKDVSSKKLKVIQGQIEWWDALMWYESDMSKGHQKFLARKFVPLRGDV